MSYVILERVVFREPKKDHRRYGIALCHRNGLSLAFVRSPEEDNSHSLVIAAQNVSAGCYEEVASATQFSIADISSLNELGEKCPAIAEQMADEARREFWLSREDSW